MGAPGLDVDRLREFLDGSCPGLVNGPLQARVIPGGKSNLTYEVSDGEHAWIVRRPPLGHVLATAHDMSREYRVIGALGPTDVPVPITYALCTDLEVIGAPFYVMEKVEGTPYREAAELERLGAERTRTISGRMVDTLTTLHEVNPVAVGLSDFGHPHGFLARQVRRWKQQLDASRTRPLPGADELHNLLERGVPAESAPAVVHGDFRLDNLLIDGHDRVTALVDWEMATVGDPLTDVGLLVVYQHLARLDLGAVVTDASTAPGHLTSDEMLARYSARSHRDLSGMGFYVGLAYFKLAAILEGIHYRYSHGQTVGAGFDTIGAMVEPLLDAGLTATREHS